MGWSTLPYPTLKILDLPLKVSLEINVIERNRFCSAEGGGQSDGEEV